MENIQKLVDVQLGNAIPRSQSVPVSFRCSEETVIELGVLAGVLGITTKSKLLSKLVPAAITEAVASLPEELQIIYKDQLHVQLYIENQLEKMNEHDV
jgi:hypothetical protein